MNIFPLKRKRKFIFFLIKARASVPQLSQSVPGSRRTRGMENDDDFTFCQVGLSIVQDGFAEENVAVGVGVDGLRIRDEGSYGNQDSGIVLDGSFSKDGAVKEEGTIGLLSFSVIDASSAKKPSEPSGDVASKSRESSDEKLQEQKVTANKPGSRAKVPFEKGYSQMNWLKLTRTHPDLAGLKGQFNKRLISLKEVKQHQSEGSMWTVLKGRVYNLSPYMKFHPGGVDILMKAVGKDCTSLFNKYHAWVNAEFLLEKCLVGTLDDGK